MAHPIRTRLALALEGEIEPHDLADIEAMRAEAIRAVLAIGGEDVSTLRRINGAAQILKQRLQEAGQ